MDNQFGLDYKYFERWVERILNSGGFKNYRPHECAREFARMSRAADEAVLLEPEFTSALHERLQTAEAERDALKADVHGWEVYVGKLLGSLPLGDIIPASSSLKDFSDRLSKMVTENYSLRNEVAALKADLDAARKQEPFAYCFTDVNGKPTQFTDAPKYSHPNDLRVIKPLYASPVPAQQSAEVTPYIVDAANEVTRALTALRHTRDAFEIGGLIRSDLNSICDVLDVTASKLFQMAKGGENER